MASRDVELVVKAKDESTKTVDAIVKALNDLTKGITSTEKSVEKGDNAFTRLGKSLSGLDKTLRGMSSAERLAQQLDTATLASEKLDKAVADTSKEVDRLAKEMTDANAITSKYQQQLANTVTALDKEQKALKEAVAGHRALKTELTEAARDRGKLETAERNLTNALEDQQTRLAKQQERFAKLKQEMASTDEPTKRLQNSFAAAETAIGKVTAQIGETEAKLAETKTALATAAQAEADYAAKVTASETSLANQREAIDKLNASKKESAKVARDSVAAENQLGKAYQSAANSLAASQTGAAKAGEALQQIRTNAAQAEQSIVELAKAAQGPLTEAYRAQQSVVSRINNAYQANRQELAQLSAIMGQVGVPTREMVEQMNRLNLVSKEVATAYKQESQVLQQLRSELNQSATTSAELAAKQRSFAQAIAQSTQTLSRVTQEVGLAAAGSQKIVTANRQAQQSYAQLGNAARETAAGNAAVAASNDKVAESYRRQANASRQAMSFIQRLRGEVLSLVSAYGGIYAVINVLNQTVEAYKTLEAAQSRLGALNKGDTLKTAQDLDFVRRQADRLGIQFGVLADSYTRFAASTANTVIAGEKTRDIFLSIAEAGRVNKLSLDDMEGIFKAVIQIASKGKFQLEELSGQLGDRLPGALQILADGLGITVQELLKLTKNGEVASSALVNFAQELDKRYGGQLEKSLQTTTTAFGRLQNAAFQALLALGEGGFIKGVTDLFNALADALKSADFAAFANSVSSAFGLVARVLAVATENFKLVAAAGAFLIGIKLAPILIGWGEAVIGFVGTLGTARAGLTAFSASVASTGVAATATAASVTLLGRAMQFLMSSTGIGLAIAAVSAGIALWATTADQASKNLEIHRDIVDRVKNAYDSAKGAVVDWGKALKDITLTEAQANLTRMIADAAEARRVATQAAAGVVANSNSLLGKLFSSADELKAGKAIADLTKQFKDGQISVADYKAQLDQIAQTTTVESIKRVATALLENANAAKTAEERVHEAQLVVKALTGTAKEQQEALDELNGVTKDVGDQQGKTSDDTGKFAEAMEKMTGVVDKANGSLATLKERLKLDEAFKAAAAAARNMGELNTAIDAYNKGLDAINAKDVGKIFGNASTSMAASKALLRDREGFSATPYTDNDGKLRIGYGSDTVTLADNSIQKVVAGMKISVADANRDLERRIGEFQNVVKGQIGADKFNSFSVQQQAALTSIAYNYGSLPDRILDAVKNGTGEEISNAIKGLGGDNGGVNRNRRGVEAATFTNVDTEAEEKLYDKREEEAQKQHERTQQRITDAQTELNAQTLINDGKGRQAAIEKAINEAKKENPNITAQELAEIEKTTGALYDQQQVRKEAKQDTKDAVAAERLVNSLLQQRNALLQQQKYQGQMGDSAGLEQTNAKLQEVNTQLSAAIENAKGMWQAIGGTAADAALARLDAAAIKAQNLQQQAKANLIDWDRVGNLFADGLTNAFDQFAQAVANGENVGEAARQAFLQFAADFLIEIGKMIIKQTIFNLLRSFGGPFANLGLGVGAAHSGGIVGSKRAGSGNPTRTVNPAVFMTAQKFHGGGFPGLAPNEVPMIAKKNEEVLSENDPRNALNGGAVPPVVGGGAPNIRIINTIDPQEFVSQGLASSPGEQGVMNIIKANRSSIRDVLENG